MSITKDGFFKQKDQLSNVYVLLAAGGHQRFGNAVGDIPVSNQLLNAGLDADMLDGKHIDELFTAFSGGAISSSGNTMSQADHSITIGGVTLYAGSSSANIVNSISVSTLLSNMTTNLTVGITVNGVASSNVSLTDLYARDSDKLDGKHLSELFTEFTDIGSQTTRITVGGVTKDLKIDADKLDGKHIDELFTAFTGGTISSANNTLTQTNHAITIGGVTLYAGSSTANIINSLSVSKLTSDSTTNLTVGITVNGVASADKTITDLYARDADKLDGYDLNQLYWANIQVQTSSSTTTTPQFTRIGLSKAIDSSYTLDSDGSIRVSNQSCIRIGTPGTGNSSSNAGYISAGPGYSTASGRYGVRILACDQSDCQSGLGQDLAMVSGISGWDNAYNFSIVGGNSSSDYGYISFVTHKVNSTSYRYLGGFYDNAGSVKYNVRGDIIASNNIGVNNYSPEFRLSVNQSSDVWHAQFGTNNGKQFRIGGSTPYGAVIGAYNSNNNSSPATLQIQRDGGNVAIGIDGAGEQKLDLNGRQQIYQRGLDNTAFKDLLLLKAQNSTETYGDAWGESYPTFGIGFRRYWTSGSDPYGETTCAGIYATISASWRGGLAFRTKNNETMGGTHDVTALRLAPSGAAYFANNVYANNVYASNVYSSFHHSSHDNDDSILLAGGGYRPVDDFLYRLRRTNNRITTQPNQGMFPPAILELISAGYPVYDDPEFESGNNSCYVYNNNGNGTVTITRQADDQGSANSSGYILKIVTNGTASPGAGGFVQTISSRANAIFIQVFRAKVPIGWSVYDAQNAQGDNASITWLTQQDGTGKWEWYARLVYCGNSGSFAGGGHVYLSGTSNTSVTWYMSHITLIDITNGNYNGLRVKYADTLTNPSKYYWANIPMQTSSDSGKQPSFGLIHLWPNGSNYYDEGIRIHPASNGWITIALCGSDNTGATGVTSSSWNIHKDPSNDFYINKGSSSPHTGYELCNVGGNWGVATNSPAYKLQIGGQVGIQTGDTTNPANLNLPANAFAINFRPGGSYTTGFYYGTYGNEFISLLTQQSITSIIFGNGYNPYSASSGSFISGDSTNYTYGANTDIIQIKQNCMNIGGIWLHSVTPDYKLKVNGTGYFAQTIQSGVSASPHNHTHIPTTSEVALATGNGNGGISAWIWRENYSSSNWGIFHNNSTDYLHIVGNSISRFSVSLGNGTIYINESNYWITSSGESNINVNGAYYLLQEIQETRLPARLRAYGQNTSDHRNVDSTCLENGFYWVNAGTQPPNVNDSDIITVNANSSYGHQLAFKFSGTGTTGATYDGKDLYTRIYSAGSWLPWYTIYTSGNTGWEYNSNFRYEPHTKRIVCTKSYDGWDQQIYSKQSYVGNCSFSFKPANKDGIYMIGLNTDPTTDTSDTSLDYAFYLHSNGNVYIYESNTNPTSWSGYNVGDEFKIEYADGYIRYYQNGVIKRTVTRSGSGAFYVDSSFYRASNIYDVEFKSMPQAINHIYGTDNTPANAMLHSGPSRGDNAAGSTWIFVDDLDLGRWGIFHNQPDNNIEFHGYGAVQAYIGLYNGGVFSKYGFHHMSANSNDYVLLAGGGYLALSSLGSSHNHDSRYLRKDTNDSTAYTIDYTTSSYGIRCGGIYGRFGSDSQLIHLYQRVNIGYPSGWGGQEAPTYGLSVYGGAWLATNTGNVAIGINGAGEQKLDVNGVQQIYQRGLDNTAFKDLLLLKAQNSTETSGDSWGESYPTFGIGFRRYWTSGSDPYGETTCAGIYATISASWRGGLAFRTKNNETMGGTHDTTALRLAPSGHAYFGNYVFASYFNSNIGDDNPTIGSVYVRNTSDNYIRRSSFSNFKDQIYASIESYLPYRLKRQAYSTGYPSTPNDFMVSGFAWCSSGSPGGGGDCNLITVAHAENSWCHQLAFKFNSAGSTGSTYDGKEIWTRMYNGSSGQWTDWYTIITNGNGYWANIPIQTSSNSATSPTFADTYINNGTLHINGKYGAYTEGIRIHPSSAGWITIALCGTDNTGTSGTSSNSWNIHKNPNNDFYINRGTSDGQSNYVLCNVGSNWGIGTVAPDYKLSVCYSGDVWHAQFGTNGGKQFRIGGSTPYGAVIGAYNSNNNSSPATLQIQRDGGNVAIGIDGAGEQKLDLNGRQQIYQRGLDNTAFKDLLLLKAQNSTETGGDSWGESYPTFGIGFRRYWTSGSSPYGETTCAGIYATVSASWRGGLAFRTKNNETMGGTHDTTALRLAPSGHAYFANYVTANGFIHSGNPSSAYVLRADGGTVAISSLGSSGNYLINYGTSNSRPNGGSFTLPGGANAVSMRSGATSGADIGIFYLSDDNAFVCNSSDNCYTFAVYDTDLTTDFSSVDAASFVVTSNGGDCKIRGNVVLTSANWSSYISVSGGGTSTTRDITAGGTNWTVTSPYTSTVDLDSIFVNASGDTMTGKLTCTSGLDVNDSELWINGSSPRIVLHYPNNNWANISMSGGTIYFNAANASSSRCNISAAAVYSSGFHHNSVDSNSYVLLAGGGYKAISDFGSSTGAYLPLAGGTMTGEIIFQASSDSSAFRPDKNNYHYIGTSSYRWWKAYINNIYSNGYHHNSADSNDYVLLAGGGYKALSEFGGSSSGMSSLTITNSASDKRYVLGYSSYSGSTTEVYACSQFYFTTSGAYHSSDRSLKHDIRDLLYTDVQRLFNTENGYIRSFAWNSNNKQVYGVIAQELQEYCPEAVDFNEDSQTYYVDYNVAFSKIIGAMFKKIKEQDKIIKELQSKVK